MTFIYSTLKKSASIIVFSGSLVLADSGADIVNDDAKMTSAHQTHLSVQAENVQDIKEVGIKKAFSDANEQTEEIKTDSTYTDYFVRGLQVAGVTAGIGAVYFYGPTAAFWGTYKAVEYGASYFLGSGLVPYYTVVLPAATNAAIFAAQSNTVAAGLCAGGAVVGKYCGDAAAYSAMKIVDGASYVADKTVALATTAAKATASAVSSAASSAYGYVSSFFG